MTERVIGVVGALATFLVPIVIAEARGTVWSVLGFVVMGHIGMVYYRYWNPR